MTRSGWRISWLVIALVALSTVFIPVVMRDTGRPQYFVDGNNPGARDDEEHGSIDKPWKTLEFAFQQLRPGHTLYVRGGTYEHSSITLTAENSGEEGAPITVKPYAGETVVLQNGGPILFYGAEWWILEGLHFSEPLGPAIRLGLHQALGYPQTVSAQHITIRDCEFGDASNTAIAIFYGLDILIENNHFHHIRVGKPFQEEAREINAVSLKYIADEIVISGNRFEDVSSDGIHLGSEAYVEGSDIGAVQITNNELWVNRPYTGILGNVGENGIDVKKCRGPILISGNTIHGFRPTTPEQDASGAHGDGLIIHGEARNVTVERNLFYDNTAHVNVAKGLGTGPRSIVIRNNIMRHSVSSDASGYMIEGSALQVRSAADVYVYHNTFFDNTQYLVSADATGCVLKNNIIVGGRAELVAKSIQWSTNYNAWSQTSEPVPALLRGRYDVRAADLELGPDLRPQPGSPVVGAGQDVGVVDDFDGNPRGNPPDMGALEHGSN